MNIKALFEPSVQNFIQQNINADIRQLALKAQGKFNLPLGFLLDQIESEFLEKKLLHTSKDPPLWIPISTNVMS